MSIDWYVACTFTRPRRVGSDSLLWPASTAHAKKLGGTTTACGQSSLTMKKLFDLPFPVDSDLCRQCLEVVSEERRRGKRPLGRSPVKEVSR